MTEAKLTKRDAVKLSVVMPVYNEEDTLAAIIDRVQAVDLEIELICVDDFSTDGSREILASKAGMYANMTVLLHPHNMGKGAAVRTGLAQFSGDIVIIQDADLEYDPQDYPALVEPIIAGEQKVVYGSRFLGHRQSMSLGHALGNKFLTLAANLLYGTALTDMETCYKTISADVARRIQLKSPRWGFDPEITARILKMGYRIQEVPISYEGRAFFAGKKISWKDGFTVLSTLIRCRFSD
ncbi:MAG: glycosyltransferase family 2 protein [Dehalococcoidia bacterium]|nr:glycosyltransferase family 2 protein [Dehalococcoidia bacterium]